MSLGDAPAASAPPLRTRFFYGWVVVAVAFVTMGIAVNARTAFSLLYPPILNEFGWDRGVTAAAFSVGFLASTASVPVIGLLIDRFGPRLVLPVSALMVAAGLWGATSIETPLGLYVTLGLLTVGGSMPMTYIGHSMFLPNWFVRRRGLAIGIAFSGVGALSIVLFPLMQAIIDGGGWRTACLLLAALCLVLLVPLNFLLQRKSPAEIGLLPDGRPEDDQTGQGSGGLVVDPEWAARDWTLAMAMRTARFWWLAAGFFFALWAWYTVLVHQTRYLVDIGFSGTEAAFALGLVPLAGVVGQIGIGHLSDQVGREWGWTVSMLGFVVCYGALILLGENPSRAVMYVMVLSQGLLGYGIASIFGAIPAEIFSGRRFATIFGVISVFGNIGAGIGPWVTGEMFDRTGSYQPAFLAVMAMSLLSIACIWIAAPRKVRLVAGRARRDA